MRATEFTNRQQPILEGKHQVQLGDLVLHVYEDGQDVDVRVMDGDRQVGYVIFLRDGKLLIPDDLSVDEKYRGRGIAKKMYDYVKSLGFKIIRSGIQTNMGKRFWDKNRGEEGNVWEEEITEDALQQDVAEAISWSSLDEGLSLEDKMTIFEEYAIRGNLTESIDQDKKDYFISLFELSNAPVKNKKYIVAPLALVGNRIMPLDAPSIMKFIVQNHNGLVFATADGKKTYPSKTLRDLSIFNTFTFASKSSYDKFRTALSLKFDIVLPSIGQEEDIAEVWSEKYKRSINCKNPKGFSQRAHCQGRKKKK